MASYKIIIYQHKGSSMVPIREFLVGFTYWENARKFVDEDLAVLNPSAEPTPEGFDFWKQGVRYSCNIVNK